MSGFAVRPDELAALDAFAADVAARGRAAVDRLRSEAEALLGEGWHGPAAGGFRLGWSEWLAGATALVTALEELAALVGASGVGYADTDDAVRSAFGGAAS